MLSQINYNGKIYYYDSNKPLTYHQIKKLGVDTEVYCKYSKDWGITVTDEVKTIVTDLDNENEVDLRGSYCCVGDLKGTLSRNDNTIEVYQLIENQDRYYIKYSELSKAVRLAIAEYEYFNQTKIEGYSFEDLIDWLDHFHYCETWTNKDKR